MRVCGQLAPGSRPSETKTTQPDFPMPLTPYGVVDWPQPREDVRNGLPAALVRALGVA
jgi:hypothetical protein